LVLMVLFASLGAGGVVVELRVWISGREVSRFTTRAVPPTVSRTGQSRMPVAPRATAVSAAAVGDRLPFSAPPRTPSAAPRRAPSVAPRTPPRAPPLAAPAAAVVALAMVAPREVVAAVSVLVVRVMAVPNPMENPL